MRNLNIDAIVWIVATFVGFLVWWPIGVGFLVLIFATAVSQQLTGYAQHEQQIKYNSIVFDRPMKQVNQIELRAISDRSSDHAYLEQRS